jgi:hypothetical protein
MRQRIKSAKPLRMVMHNMVDVVNNVMMDRPFKHY